MSGARGLGVLALLAGCYDFSPYHLDFSELSDGAAGRDGPSAMDGAGGGDLAQAMGTLLVGDNTLEVVTDDVMPGQIEAFQFTARENGTASRMWIYVDDNTVVAQVPVALYDNGAGAPGALLTWANVPWPSMQPGWYGADTVSTHGITAGQRYWIAVLAPNAGGAIHFRDESNTNGTPSAQLRNWPSNTFPDPWPGSTQPGQDGPISAYVTTN